MKKYLLIVLVLFSSVLQAVPKPFEKRIKVLFTSAIIPERAEERRLDYIKNLKLLKKYGCDVYVVESCQEGPTYLDRYCKNVYYTKSNDPSVSKSSNEVTSMYMGLKKFNFDPEEVIIKVTGRYVLKDDTFINFVRNHLEADVIARVWHAADAYTGYFAMRVRFFEDFLENHYLALNDPHLLIEHALGKYISKFKDNLNIVSIRKLYDYPFSRGLEK